MFIVSLSLSILILTLHPATLEVGELRAVRLNQALR